MLGLYHCTVASETEALMKEGDGGWVKGETWNRKCRSSSGWTTPRSEVPPPTAEVRGLLLQVHFLKGLLPTHSCPCTAFLTHHKAPYPHPVTLPAAQGRILLSPFASL